MRNGNAPKSCEVVRVRELVRVVRCFLIFAGEAENFESDSSERATTCVAAAHSSAIRLGRICRSRLRAAVGSMMARHGLAILLLALAACAGELKHQNKWPLIQHATHYVLTHKVPDLLTCSGKTKMQPALCARSYYVLHHCDCRLRE